MIADVVEKGHVKVFSDGKKMCRFLAHCYKLSIGFEDRRAGVDSLTHGLMVLLAKFSFSFVSSCWIFIVLRILFLEKLCVMRKWDIGKE